MTRQLCDGKNVEAEIVVLFVKKQKLLNATQKNTDFLPVHGGFGMAAVSGRAVLHFHKMKPVVFQRNQVNFFVPATAPVAVQNGVTFLHEVIFRQPFAGLANFQMRCHRLSLAQFTEICYQ